MRIREERGELSRRERRHVQQWREAGGLETDPLRSKADLELATLHVQGVIPLRERGAQHEAPVGKVETTYFVPVASETDHRRLGWCLHDLEPGNPQRCVPAVRRLLRRTPRTQRDAD